MINLNNKHFMHGYKRKYVLEIAAEQICLYMHR